MENKLINVVWCDDAIDNHDNPDNQELFANHNCTLFKKARTSDELKKILTDEKGNIDAVIVDFNVSATDLIPGRDSASGFRWVHEHVEEYDSIPFYLYSARDFDFIKRKYADYEFPMDGDYFFRKNLNIQSKRNRYFQANELDDLLEIMEEEVAFVCTPTYRIRQEYSEAFAAINKFNLEGDIFLKILLSDESIDRYDLINLANPMRMVIESLVSQLDSGGVIPTWYANQLNKVPDLLSGGTEERCFYLSQDNCFMSKSLFNAFNFFLAYTQDGSHDKNKDYLNLAFREYLKSEKDVFIVKALAIICLDIIKWAARFYEKYQPLHLFPFRFKPFKTQVRELATVKGKQGGYVYDSEGCKYFLPQFSHPFMFKVGTNVEVKSINQALPQQDGELIYYINYGKNLDV